MDAFPPISEGTGNTPNAILGTAQAGERLRTLEIHGERNANGMAHSEWVDRPSIVLGGIDLRERRVNYASGVVEWRVVRQGQVSRRIGRNLVPMTRRHTNLYQPYGVGARRPARESMNAEVISHRSIDELQRSLEILTMEGDLGT
ncbi:hypothetical protein B0H13DRAFT_1862135 [Mycena leptocephala]|nr:hypothetical protein B0H13DRAFT_1862135 [Mycena leptocephala]